MVEVRKCLGDKQSLILLGLSIFVSEKEKKVSSQDDLGHGTRQGMRVDSLPFPQPAASTHPHSLLRSRGHG